MKRVYRYLGLPIGTKKPPKRRRGDDGLGAIDQMLSQMFNGNGRIGKPQIRMINVKMPNGDKDFGNLLGNTLPMDALGDAKVASKTKVLYCIIIS